MPSGGRRPGAGRKYLYGAQPMTKLDVWMPRAMETEIAQRAQEHGCSRSEIIVNLLAQVLHGRPLTLPAFTRQKRARV